MKLLRIDGNQGYFRAVSGDYIPVEKISKDNLMQLVTWILSEADTEMDAYDESRIKNQAQQIIYKNVESKLRSLRERAKEFVDESQRLFLTEYEKYRDS